jgi:hypothetical protein
MSVAGRRPGGKRIGKRPPTVFPLREFRIGQETGIEAALKDVWIDIQGHDSQRLATVAERFFPFVPRAFRHLRFARAVITRGPPFPGRRAMPFRSGTIQSADVIHSRREPKETFRSKDVIETVLQQVPQSLGVKRLSRAIRQDANSWLPGQSRSAIQNFAPAGVHSRRQRN